MSESATVVVRTGTANLASVLAALGRLGVTARASNAPADVQAAGRVVLPGVGAYGSAMDRLAADDLIDPLRQRIRTGMPTLGICLGMQLLFNGSDESPDRPGLGVVPGKLQRFERGVRVPQMGWNRIVAEDCDILQSGYVYFANSYRAVGAPDGWSAAMADHGGTFLAAIGRGPVVACQFHPELSGSFGLALIRRWLSIGGAPC